MKKVAILRGINVGGKRKMLMAGLKSLLLNLGYTDVCTYIQSGNVVFETDIKKDNLQIAEELASAINNQYGFDVPVIVREGREIEEIVTKNPFSSACEAERLHVVFLKEVPFPELIGEIEQYDFSPDKLEFFNQHVFIYCSGKYSDSKLTNRFFESKLKVSTTTRNWKTVLKLSELSQYEK